MNKNKKIDYNILRKFVRLLENNLELRGAKGFGASHPYKKKIRKPGLGKSEFEDFDVQNPEPKSKIDVAKYFTEEENDDKDDE